MESLKKDTLISNGYKYWDGFCDTKDLERASNQAWDFYKKAISEGIFYDKNEAKEIGLIYEKDGKLIRAWMVDGYSGPRTNLRHEDNIMYNEFSWFFKSKTFQKLTDEIKNYTGPDLDMSMAKLIITLPVKLFPSYVRDIYLPQKNVHRGSLIPLVKEKFRRAFYFAHNPWHQDTIDYPDGDNLSYTTLISLTNRLDEQAPLLFCPESSALGVVPYPFDYTIKDNMMVYKNNEKMFRLKINRANVKSGDLFVWHAYNFHTVKPCFSDEPAIALRFNFTPSLSNNGIHDKRNIREVSRSVLSMFTETCGRSKDHNKENN